ncbi:MAG: hypothetical protein DRJ47_10775 [Thermoprotei archaeon]|nr:MAG: hypothetical protein DRJ47_10775 [Thermoprotei archaeon]
MERIVAWINGQPWREWTKHDYKLALRKFIQYAKHGSCNRETPIPEEVGDSAIALTSWLRRFTEAPPLEALQYRTTGFRETKRRIMYGVASDEGGFGEGKRHLLHLQP